MGTLGYILFVSFPIQSLFSSTNSHDRCDLKLCREEQGETQEMQRPQSLSLQLQSPLARQTACLRGLCVHCYTSLRDLYFSYTLPFKSTVQKSPKPSFMPPTPTGQPENKGAGSLNSVDRRPGLRKRRCSWSSTTCVLHPGPFRRQLSLTVAAPCQRRVPPGKTWARWSNRRRQCHRIWAGS